MHDDAPLVLVDVAVYIGSAIAFGYAGHRLPASRLAHDNAVTRIRPFEDHGAMWQRRLRVRRWKDRLPEAGAFFGGRSKKHIDGRDDLAPLLAETRRAELVHWWLVASSPLFALWNPAWLATVMIVFAIVANAPCIIVQRFNRARLARIDARRTVRR